MSAACRTWSEIDDLQFARNPVPNGSNQRLATLREPHRPILSRVRCIALFGRWSRSGIHDECDHATVASNQLFESAIANAIKAPASTVAIHGTNSREPCPSSRENPTTSRMVLSAVATMDAIFAIFMTTSVEAEHPRSAARGKGFAKMTALFASPLHCLVLPVARTELPNAENAAHNYAYEPRDNPDGKEGDSVEASPSDCIGIQGT